MNNHLQYKECKNCGNKFSPKRADQKFCHPRCKSRHHNEANKYINGLLQKLNSALKHNREILRSFYESGQFKVSYNLLQQHGFDPISDSKRGSEHTTNKYIYCYLDYCLIQEPDGNFLIDESPKEFL